MPCRCLTRPTALVVQDIVWQANDPLVHYLASDLNNPTAGQWVAELYLNWPGNLGKVEPALHAVGVAILRRVWARICWRLKIRSLLARMIGIFPIVNH